MDMAHFANPWFDNVVAMGLDSYQPGLHYEYNGLGCTLEYGPCREDVPEDAPEEDRSLLGPMLNHGSATGPTMYTGLENGLIVAMARQATGADYNAHRDELLRVVGEYLGVGGE